MGPSRAISTDKTITNSTDVIAGGIAPSRKLRGRRTTSTNPRISRTKPLTASDTGFAIGRG